MSEAVTPSGRAVFYGRCSTDEQATSGLGIEAQIRAAKEWCRVHKIDLHWPPFLDEGVSGSEEIDHRQALPAALAELLPGDVLLVAKRDRLGRDPILAATIDRLAARRRARVVSAAGEGTGSDEPSEVLMRRIVDVFAEYELGMIRARTKAGLASKRARGERTGGIPYGWVLDPAATTPTGRLVPEPTEQARIDWIWALRERGLTLRAIAAELDRAGVPTKKNRPNWTHAAVQKILSPDRRPRP